MGSGKFQYLISWPWWAVDANARLVDPGFKKNFCFNERSARRIDIDFVENSSGCPFNYLIEMITAFRRHFYILISFKRNIDFWQNSIINNVIFSTLIYPADFTEFKT